VLPIRYRGIARSGIVVCCMLFLVLELGGDDEKTFLVNQEDNVSHQAYPDWPGLLEVRIPCSICAWPSIHVYV
jgi:hypothetical protein